MPFQKKLIFIAALNFLILMALFFTGIFAPVEYKIYDLMVKLQEKKAVAQNIVIVTVDDKSIENLNARWPWNRGLFADALKKIGADLPKAIALDFIFSEKTIPEQDQLLFSTLEKLNGIRVISGLNLKQEIVPEKIGMEKVLVLETTEQLPVFKEMGYGYINVFTDDDGFIRRTDLSRRHEGKDYDVFALAVLKEAFPNQYHYWKSQNQASYLINFAGPDKTFPRVSFYQVIHGMVPKNYFKDKVVLIGPTFADSQDFHSTPFLSYEGVNARMAGVEIHANVLENLINRCFYKEVPEYLNLIALLLLNAVVLILFLMNLSFARLIIFELLSIMLYYAFLILSVFIFHAVFVGFLPVFTCIILFNILLILHQVHKNKEMAKELDTLQSDDLHKIEAFCKKYDITKREKDILLLIMNNHTKNEIGKKLFISPNTVKRHIYNIYKKTNVENREDLIKMI